MIFRPPDPYECFALVNFSERTRVGREVLSDRRAARDGPVPLIVVQGGSPLAAGASLTNPWRAGKREPLKSRRVCETRIGLPGRPAPRPPEPVIDQPVSGEGF